MTYTVRVELKVLEAEFVDMEVEATSKEEAIAKAMEAYELGTEAKDVYAGERVSTEVDKEHCKDWEVSC